MTHAQYPYLSATWTAAHHAPCFDMHPTGPYCMSAAMPNLAPEADMPGDACIHVGACSACKHKRQLQTTLRWHKELPQMPHNMDTNSEVKKRMLAECCYCGEIGMEDHGIRAQARLKGLPACKHYGHRCNAYAHSVAGVAERVGGRQAMGCPPRMLTALYCCHVTTRAKAQQSTSLTSCCMPVTGTVPLSLFIHNPVSGLHARLTNIMEQCSLLLPLRWGAGPMVLLLWLECVT
jgi:hypothetical protein